MLDRVFLCCWTPPTGCESSQAAPMTPIQPSESRACVVVSPYAVLPRNFQSTLIWVTYNRQTIRRIPCTKNSYTRRCTKHEVRVSVELILEKPLWPHLAPPHITMEPASNCPISADPSYRAAKNAMHSATAAAPSGGSCQGRSGAQIGDVGAPQCWLRVRVQHHTKFHNELWGFYARNTIDSFNWTLSLASGPLKQYNIKDLKR